MADRPRITAAQVRALARWVVSFRPHQRDWTIDACSHAIERAIVERTDDPVELARAFSEAANRPNVVEPDQMADDGPQWPTEVITSRRRAELTLLGEPHPDRVLTHAVQGELLP